MPGHWVRLLVIGLGGAFLLAACEAPAAAPSASTSPTPAATTPSAEALTASPPAPAVGAKVGDRAPDFEVTTITGEKIALAQLIESKTPVVLYFYATW